MAKWEHFTDDELREIFKNSSSYKDILSKMGYSQNGKNIKMIKRIAEEKKIEIPFDTRSLLDRKTDEEFKEILLNSSNCLEVVKKLGYQARNENLIKRIRDRAEKLNISLDYLVPKKEKPKKEKYVPYYKRFSNEELKNIIETSQSLSEASKRIGFKSFGGYEDNFIRKIALDNNWQAPYLEYHRRTIKDYLGTTNGYLEVVKEIDGKLGCKCHLCNREDLYLVSISNFSRAKSCGCSHKLIPRYEDLTGQTFQKLKVIKYNKEVSKKYNRTYWDCECLICGNIITTSAMSLKRNKVYSCGCTGKRRSLGELRIHELLTKLNIPFKTEYSFSDLRGKKYPLRFDFAIFDNEYKYLKCLIEYQGAQHYGAIMFEPYENILERDNRKREYCKENGIILIEIPYTDYDKIDTQYLLNKLKEVNV